MTKSISVNKYREMLKEGGQRASRQYREHQEQSAFVAWARYNRPKIPELKLLYAIPNANKRSKLEGQWLKDEGLESGVPDMNLDVARGPYHGLRIEFKAPDDKPAEGKLSKNQRIWRELLEDQGYKYVVLDDWQAARDCVLEYLEL